MTITEISEYEFHCAYEVQSVSEVQMLMLPLEAKLRWRKQL
jgi:hypothetical protein